MSAGRRAWHVAVGVRNLVAVLETHCGVFLEEGDHLWRGFEKGGHLRFVEVRAEHVAQIGARLLDVLDDPSAAGERIARRPHPATRPRGGAPEHRLLLCHYHLEAVRRSRYCGGESGGARTDDEEVAIDSFLHWV